MRLINSTSLVFVAIILLVVGWIGSGMLTREAAGRTTVMIDATWLKAHRAASPIR